MKIPIAMNTQNNLKESLRTGFKKGLAASFKILRIMLPISLAVTILRYFGTFERIGILLEPVSRILGLRFETFVAFLTGIFVNCYSAIAVIVSTPLGEKELIIISIMLLFSHTLPIEIAIQKKAGGNGFLILIARLFASITAALVLKEVLPPSSSIYFESNVSVDGPAIPFSQMLADWVTSSLVQTVKIVLIVICIIIINEYLINTKIADSISKRMNPFMKILGLSSNYSFRWFIVVFFGLIYGSSVLIDSKQRMKPSPTKETAFHLSISTSHALIQETAIFAAIGTPILWLLLPRILYSLGSVWLFLFLKSLFGRIKETGGESRSAPP